MKNLTAYTNNETNNKFQKIKLSKVVLCSDNQRIINVDNSRVEPIIIIYDNTQAPNEQIIFEGTQKQLIERLKN